MRKPRNVILLEADEKLPPMSKMHSSDMVLKFSGEECEKLNILKSRYSNVGHYIRVLNIDTIARRNKEKPISMLLWCPSCNERHIDEGEFATKEHHTHACQSCGMVWRPAIVPTVGVRFLPGFKDK